MQMDTDIDGFEPAQSMVWPPLTLSVPSPAGASPGFTSVLSPAAYSHSVSLVSPSHLPHFNAPFSSAIPLSSPAASASTRAPAIPATPPAHGAPLVSPASASAVFTFEKSLYAAHSPNMDVIPEEYKPSFPDHATELSAPSAAGSDAGDFCSCGMHPPVTPTDAKPAETIFNGVRWRLCPPFQNLYVSERGEKHVCDFNCPYKVWSEEVHFFCCAISRRPSRSFARKKRQSEEDLAALAQQQLQRHLEQRFEDGTMAVDQDAQAQEELQVAPLKKVLLGH